jgi:UDP-N-acetyl-D-mannosaminuronic acid transferase (WecB/TagA/CpsF family)
MDGGFRQVLGIRFYTGGVPGLLEQTARGGLVVVPSAPVLVNAGGDPANRAALEGCDFAITDSAYMVLLWLVIKRERLQRISGLRFLRALLERAEFRAPGATLWVMPSAEDGTAMAGWLRRRGVGLEPDACPVAPHYPSGPLSDPGLLALIEARRPRYVVMNIGGGVQERLGLYLRNNLSYRPAILCTGAAVALISGRQARIPVWADRLFLGWLIRSLANPVSFPPRLWKSIRLAWLVARYGARSPAGSA